MSKQPSERLRVLRTKVVRTQDLIACSLVPRNFAPSLSCPIRPNLRLAAGSAVCRCRRPIGPVVRREDAAEDRVRDELEDRRIALDRGGELVELNQAVFGRVHLAQETLGRQAAHVHGVNRGRTT